MKRFLLGSVALAAMIAGPAMAADMPLKAPPPVVVYSWTGCYVGGHVGGKSSRSDLTYGNTFGIGFGGVVPEAGADLTGRSTQLRRFSGTPERSMMRNAACVLMGGTG